MTNIICVSSPIEIDGIACVSNITDLNKCLQNWTLKARSDLQYACPNFSEMTNNLECLNFWVPNVRFFKGQQVFKRWVLSTFSKSRPFHGVLGLAPKVNGHFLKMRAAICSTILNCSILPLQSSFKFTLRCIAKPSFYP